MQIKSKILNPALLSVALSLTSFIAAHAQYDLSGSPVSTLRTPLIYGASSAPPYVQAPEGQAPACGDGAVPAPVTPGMGGPPTLLPFVNSMPANDIQNPSYTVPYSPSTLSYPGQYGPSTYTPPPPSTPGMDPGIVTHPRDFYSPPVSVVSINPGGGISGAAPMTRWGGQTSRDFGRYKHQGTRKFDFGIQAIGSMSQDGPWQNRGQGKPTADLYGNRYSMKNSSPPTQTIAPY